MVFGAQILLDIHQVLQADITRGFVELQTSAQAASNLTKFVTVSGNLQTMAPYQHEQLVPDVREFIDF